MHYVKINDIKQPFRFGQRELQTASVAFSGLAKNGKQIEYEELGKRVFENFDLFMNVFMSANKKGCRRHNKEHDESIEPLSEIELEDAMDDDPRIYEDLIEAFNNSRTAKYYDEKHGAEENNKKKPKS